MSDRIPDIWPNTGYLAEYQTSGRKTEYFFGVDAYKGQIFL